MSDPTDPPAPVTPGRAVQVGTDWHVRCLTCPAAEHGPPGSAYMDLITAIKAAGWKRDVMGQWRCDQCWAAMRA
jgi:hypothetical protein